MINRIDPDLLQTFVSIAETGSFQRTAKRVNRTQSAVSMQISRLETIIGSPLFIRERPSVRLTKKGEILLNYAHRMLRLQDEAWMAVTKPEPAGLVRFGIPDDYATGLLPQILEKFSRQYSEIEIEVTCATSPQLVELVDSDEIDLALISRDPIRPVGSFVKHEPLVWAVSAQHATHLKEPVPLAVFQKDCFARQYAITALSQSGREYRIAFSSPNLAALLALTHAGIAVAAMPRSSVTPGLRILSVRDGFPELPKIELGLIRSSHHQSAGVDALAACIENSEEANEE